MLLLMVSLSCNELLLTLDAVQTFILLLKFNTIIQSQITSIRTKYTSKNKQLFYAGNIRQQQQRMFCLSLCDVLAQIQKLCYMNCEILTVVLQREMGDRRLWTPEEDQVIVRLIEELGTSQWTTIAIQMRQLLPHARTSKQIRQRWHNQLSPSITRAPWTAHEEATLFSLHSTLGNRWKDIAWALKGRTDNSVKNHFYSTVRRALRRLDKHFGFKDSTKKMRSLKPASLTHLLETARNLPDYQEMMTLLLQFAQWKPSRGSRECQPQGRELYRNIIEMINTFNNSYRRSVKDRQSFVVVKEEEGSSNEYVHTDNLSTVSDGQVSEENMVENYFGSVGEAGSWFSVNEREWGGKMEVAEEELGILCDLEMFQ